MCQPRIAFSGDPFGYANMTPHERFEQVMAEQTKTLDEIRATIERIRYLIDVITEQINLEQQWTSSYPEMAVDRPTDERLGSIA